MTTPIVFIDKSITVNPNGRGIQFSESLLSTGDFTIEAYIKGNSLYTDTGWGRYLFGQYDLAAADFSTGRFFLGLPENTANVNKPQAFHPNMGVLQSPTALSAGVEYHLAFSKTGTTTRLFVNGTLKASGTLSVALSAAKSNLGEILYGQAKGIWDGTIRKFRITLAGLYSADFDPSAQYGADSAVSVGYPH